MTMTMTMTAMISRKLNNDMMTELLEYYNPYKEASIDVIEELKGKFSEINKLRKFYPGEFENNFNSIEETAGIGNWFEYSNPDGVTGALIHEDDDDYFLGTRLIELGARQFYEEWEENRLNGLNAPIITLPMLRKLFNTFEDEPLMLYDVINNMVGRWWMNDFIHPLLFEEKWCDGDFWAYLW